MVVRKEAENRASEKAHTPVRFEKIEAVVASAGTDEIIVRGAIFGVREEAPVDNAVELRVRADFFLENCGHAYFNESIATDASFSATTTSR